MCPVSRGYVCGLVLEAVWINTTPKILALVLGQGSFFADRD